MLGQTALIKQKKILAVPTSTSALESQLLVKIKIEPIKMCSAEMK